MQECLAGVGSKDEGSVLSVAFRHFLYESTNEIIISVGEASCFILLEMRDVNLLLLKIYVTG